MKPPRIILSIMLGLLLIASAYASSDDRNLRVTQSNNAASGKRIALVIGNSKYINSPLKNPVNDARDVAARLKGLGFEVVERNDLTTKQIGGMLREFRSKLVPGAVALVFYAGHGIQIKGDNYLPAVDADINSEEDVPNQSLAVRQVMDVLDEAKTRLNLVFLDACRNNPYARSFRSADRGLARISAPSGTLISYATRPGSVAGDGAGHNGLYTSKLLEQMDSTQQIELVLKRVVTEVKLASNGNQEPWMEGSIEGDFCFKGCQVASLEAVPIPTPIHVKTKEEIEDETWSTAESGNTVEAINAYLAGNPKGRYATQAKVRLATLKKQTREQAQVDNESALWDAVEKGNSKYDYSAYLAQYPDGKFTALAKGRIKKLDDEAVADSNRREQEKLNESRKADADLAVGQRKQSEEAESDFDTQGGLMWLPINNSRMSWADADAYCTHTATNGQISWRLPTKDELSALHASGAAKRRWTQGVVWSATPDGSDSHYSVGLSTGTVGSHWSTRSFYVTCVRQSFGR